MEPNRVTDARATARAAQSDAALVQVRGLRTVLNGKTIFDGIDLDIPRGKITAIMGPSGTGKTTLLRHITGQLMPDAGQIHVDAVAQCAVRSAREDRFPVPELGAADRFQRL